MKIVDIIILLILVALAALAIRFILKRKKSGRPIGCTGNCSTCHMYCENKIQGGNQNEGKKQQD